MNSAHQTLLSFLQEEPLFELKAEFGMNGWWFRIESCDAHIWANARKPSWEAACNEICRQLRYKNLL